MNTKDYFKDIYKDFFNIETKEFEHVPLNETEESKNVKQSNLIERINSLYLDSDSKNLLKQIVEYMRKYNEKLETNYISFQILLEVNNDELRDLIINILYDAATAYNYINGTFNNLSLYHVEETTDINEVYSKNAFICLSDINGLDLCELDVKKKFVHDFEKNLNIKDKITLISGTKEQIDTFFLGYNDMKNNHFTFSLKYSKPDVQDIYNGILESIKLEDEDRIKLLDYISATYPLSNDFVTYKYNLIEELAFKKQIPSLPVNKTMEEIFSELNDLVGLTKVKKVLNDLVDVKELKSKSDDLKISNLNLHMVFLGNPGTGKTTVARIVAQILYNLKYIKENKLIEVSAKDLVAEYVGQTAPKTNAVIEKALGGVLFIDEAYALASKGNENSYNAEAIATLIQNMENYRDNLVVIFAGYTKEMQSFLDSNSGIVSRIGYNLEFDDYTEDELVKIFNNFVKKAGFITSSAATKQLREVIKKYIGMENFGNARFIRNVYEKTIIKHANNTKNSKNKDVLRTLTKEDISDEYLVF